MVSCDSDQCVNRSESISDTLRPIRPPDLPLLGSDPQRKPLIRGIKVKKAPLGEGLSCRSIFFFKIL